MPAPPAVQGAHYLKAGLWLGSSRRRRRADPGSCPDARAYVDADERFTIALVSIPVARTGHGDVRRGPSAKVTGTTRTLWHRVSPGDEGDLSPPRYGQLQASNR